MARRRGAALPPPTAAERASFWIDAISPHRDCRALQQGDDLVGVIRRRLQGGRLKRSSPQGQGGPTFRQNAIARSLLLQSSPVSSFHQVEHVIGCACALATPPYCWKCLL